MNARIPVLLLGGFPGAGKTALLGRWLADPDFSDSAIVVSDAGDAALDSYLVAAGKLPARACVRCAGPQGIAATLDQLAHDRERRDAPPFERVLVEARGLADPARLLEDLAAGTMPDRYPLQGVVTVVDAVEAMAQLESQPRWRAHARMADALVITKTDLVESAAVERLAAELARINPDAEIVQGVPFGASRLWDAASSAPGRDVRRMHAALGEEGAAEEAIGSLCVRFAHAVELSGFCVRLAAFLETHAGKVLRVKGLVRVQGRHGPAVIQAVGRTLYPVRTLKEWPAGLDGSALVVTAMGLADDVIRMGIAGGEPARRGST
jgi:G3E family GTPase